MVNISLLLNISFVLAFILVAEVSHLNEWLIMQSGWDIVFSGVNHSSFTPPSHIGFPSKTCFTPFKSMYCFMRTIKQDYFHIILKPELEATTSISQKSCWHIFSMCFVVLFQQLSFLFFSITMHKHYSLKNSNIYMHVDHILW